MSQDQEQQMKKVEISIEQAREAIEYKTAVLRLSQNRDFKMLIEEGYFKQEPSRLVLMLADATQQNELSQQNIIKDMEAIGRFREYLRIFIMAGTQAEGAIASHEQTREELAEEIG
jgi:hypothetical protein